MHWSESNLPVSMQGKSKALRNIYIEAANKSFSKFEDEQAALFAASQAVSSEERKLANEKRKSAPVVPLHLKAVLDAAKTAFEPASKRETIQQAFLPKNALQSGLNRSLVSADFDDKGQLVLLFDTGEKIVTSEIAIKEYIEQNIAIAPSTQIVSSDDSITVVSDGNTFDLCVTPPVDQTVISSPDGSINVLKDGSSYELSVSEASPASTLVMQVRNETGATLTKGTVVYISGAAGNKPLVHKALATADQTSAQTLGLITNDIGHNKNGYVTLVGAVTNLNTLAFTEGVQLYLSSTVSGTYTSVKQHAPAHLVYIGVVTRSHQTQGVIEVKVQNGYELDELHDVKLNGLSNGDVLTWNSTTSLWENKPTAAPPDVSKTITYFSKISTTAGIAYTVEHNMGLVDKDAFTINTMLAGSQVQTAVSSVNTNSLTITTSVATIDLAVTIIGIKP
jgi:hypothetical protein